MLSKKILVMFVAIAWSGTFANSSLAAIVFVVGNGTGLIDPVILTPGTERSVPVFARLTAETGQPSLLTITNYTLRFEFGGDARGIPVGFSGFEASPLGSGFNIDGVVSLTQNNGPFPNFDFTASDVNAAGVPLSVGGPDVKLFDLVFDIASDTTGIFEIAFVANPIGVTNTVGGATGATLASAGGSIEITAVPEPSSMLVLAGLVAGGGYRQWRRKKLQAVPSTGA